jgi:hypothetical protein
MSDANPLWLEGRRKYWTRPDGYRFFKPGSPEAKMPGWLGPWATRVRMEEAAEEEARAQAEAAQEQFERDLCNCAGRSRSSSSNTSCGASSRSTARTSRACRPGARKAGNGRAVRIVLAMPWRQTLH